MLLQMNLSILIAIFAIKPLVIQGEHHVNREHYSVRENVIEINDRSADTAVDVDVIVKAHEDKTSDFGRSSFNSGQNMEASIRPKRESLEESNAKSNDLHTFATQLTTMEKNQNDLLKRIVSQNEMIKDLASQINDVIRTTRTLQNTVDAKVIGSERLEQKRATALDEALSSPTSRKKFEQMMHDMNQISYFFATTMIKKEKIPYISGCSGENSDIVSCLRPGISDMYDLLTIPVRIAGGNFPYEGRVEVYIKGEFTTICDHGWDYRDAQVVCKMLGYARGGTLQGASFLGGYYFKGGRGVQRMSNVECTGEEDSILSCPYSKPSFKCGHYDDAGVRCEN